jgi:hypothetical protein
MYSYIHLLKHALAQLPNLLKNYGFLGYVQERERCTFDWVNMYTIEFLEVGTMKRPTMDLIVLQRHQNNMLNLHATNKENMPHELTLNNKRQSI